MTLQTFFGRGWLALAFLVIYVISQSLIANVLHSGDASHLLFQFQFSYTAADFQALLDSISAGQLQALQGHFAYDHIHPLWYGGLIVCLTAWLLKKNQLGGKWNLLIVTGVIPSVMDLTENSIHEPVFMGLANADESAITVAAICATIKWSMAAAYLLFAIALGIRALRLRNQ